MFFDSAVGQQDEGNDQHQREHSARQHAGLQIVASPLAHRAHQAGSDRAAQVPGHGQQREKRGPAPGQARRYDADGSRPHDAHGKAAQHAADQPQRGIPGQGSQQIAAQAQQSGTDHVARQVDPRAEFAVDDPADTHGRREQAGTCQIAHRLGEAQRRFGVGGGPLGHAHLRRPGADHQQDGQPEQRRSQQLPDGHALALLRQSLDGAGGEVIDVVKRNQRPQAVEIGWKG